MATDFDFDGSFNEDPDDEGSAEEYAEEEESSGGRNRLRTIILILFIIILACVACFVLPPRLGINIPVINPAPTEQAQVPPTAETTEPAPATDEAGPGETPTDDGSTEEDEQPVVEETVEPAPEVTTEPQPEATEEVEVVPTEDQTVGEHDEEAVEEEPEPGATTEPGSDETDTENPDTSEPEPMESCDGNTPPTAEFEVDPNPAMMGKGQAIVTVDASGSSDDGMIVEYGWNFGDGTGDQTGPNANTTHAYETEGTFIITLTVLDDCEATDSTTVEVTIVGPTPPADDNQATATPTPSSDTDDNITLGFCYKVQPGDTLSGIALSFGVPLHDLARVNNVTTEYFVLAGQGLFVPSEPIKPGPNGYQVQTGDTLNSIAFQCGVTVSHLAQVNGLSYDAALTPGQVVIVPIGYR